MQCGGDGFLLLVVEYVFFLTSEFFYIKVYDTTIFAENRLDILH